MRTCGIAALLLLAACSSGGSVDSPKALAEKIGCADSYSSGTTEEVGVEAVGQCRVDGKKVRLLTFANNDARDGFVQVAQGFGSRYVTGDKFAVECNDAATEAAVKKSL